METLITSEMISQQTTCGVPENIEIVNDMETKLTQSKEQIEIMQTRKNLMPAWKVYFKYFSSQKWFIPKVLSKEGQRQEPQPQESQSHSLSQHILLQPKP